ncbi:MAG: hypothetical protein H7282_06095 [Cytophagaceae bacterium]|nr:hypothetical protein [Cytophagaceae bacterium]
MTHVKIIFVASIVFILASCSSESESEMLERDAPNDTIATSEIKQIDSGIRAADYIPPIGTGQSSAGNVKRERKFHIR